jgi:nucleotide-binding universal stress UspA family protein
LIDSAARCGVAVVPQGTADRSNAGLHVIGVAYDGSPESGAALATAQRIALAAHATLHIIAVLEPASWLAAGLPALAGYAEPEAKARGRLDRSLARAVARAPSDLCALPVRATGSPAVELALQATDLDLLVAGSRGYGPPGSVSLGSVSSTLLRSLPCPVLIVPRPEADREARDAELSSAPPADRDSRASGPTAEYPSLART